MKWMRWPRRIPAQEVLRARSAERARIVEMTIRLRRHVAYAALAVLLSMQFAMAAFACWTVPLAGLAAAADDHHHHAHPDGAGISHKHSSPIRDVACHEHCAGNDYSVTAVWQVALPPTTSFRVAQVSQNLPPPETRQPRIRARSTSPPLTILNCCFRI